jgi:hypothetical protein
LLGFYYFVQEDSLSFILLILFSGSMNSFLFKRKFITKHPKNNSNNDFILYLFLHQILFLYIVYSISNFLFFSDVIILLYFFFLLFHSIVFFIFWYYFRDTPIGLILWHWAQSMFFALELLIILENIIHLQRKWRR